jgi:hypothetical protein
MYLQYVKITPIKVMQNTFGKHVCSKLEYTLPISSFLLFIEVQGTGALNKIKDIHIETTTYFHASYENCDLP